MHPGKLPSLLLLVLAAAGFTACAEEAAPSRSSATPEAAAAVLKTIDDLAATPAAASGTVGFYLAPLEASGEALAARESHQSFITASTMKTLSTGSALELLGPDFRFETKLLFSAATGDILIQGAGDPSLGRPDWQALFDEWTTALQNAGIREIHGRVIADERAWESQEIPDGWAWLDIGNYYAPPLTPLCYQDNTLRVYFDLEGKPGGPARVRDADPWPAGLDFVSELRVGKPGTGDNAYLYGGPGTPLYVARGTFAADYGRDYIKGALPDPALFCAQHFTAWLMDHGIPVHGAASTSRLLEKQALLEESAATSTAPAKATAPVRGRKKVQDRDKDTVKDTAASWMPADARTVASHFSAPLREMLIPINHRSLNLDCECLLRTLGKGSSRAGLRRIREHFASKGLPLAGYEQSDGSGLSRSNMVTPELLARANASFLTGPYGGDYLASLPEVGQSGSTLGGLDAAPGAVIHAKSGTIERVKSYTGQVRTADGRRFIFAVLVNNYDGSYSRQIAPGLDAMFEALGKL